MDFEDCVTLLKHTEWADASIWKAVLASGQADSELHAKLHHIHLVQWAYLSLWRDEPVNPRELGSFGEPRQIRDWARDYFEELPEYLAKVSGEDVAREVRFPWADRLVERFGKAQPASWAESVLQIAMHSTSHRGQVARRLRELGAEAPLTDFIAWVWRGRPPADWADPPTAAVESQGADAK